MLALCSKVRGSGGEGNALSGTRRSLDSPISRRRPLARKSALFRVKRKRSALFPTEERLSQPTSQIVCHFGIHPPPPKRPRRGFGNAPCPLRGPASPPADPRSASQGSPPSCYLRQRGPGLSDMSGHQRSRRGRWRKNSAAMSCHWRNCSIKPRAVICNYRTSSAAGCGTTTTSGASWYRFRCRTRSARS